MKKSMIKHIVLGTLASAILTACGGGDGSSDPAGKEVCDFTIHGANPLQVNLGENYIEPGFTVKDLNDRIIQGEVTGSVDTSTAGNYTLTYGAESCSNSVSRTVTVLPAVAGSCNYILNGDNPLTLTVGTSYQEPGVTIKDNSNQMVTGTVSGTVNKDTVGSYTLTYQSDSCTNTTTRTVNVVPATCSYTLNGDNPLLVDKGDDLNDPGVVVKNSSNQIVSSNVSGEVDTSTLGDYTLTYQGEGCANTETRTVKVQLQTCAYTLLGDSPLEVIINSTYSDPGAEIKDKSGNVILANAMGTGNVDTTKVGEYVVTYANESCGNTSDRIVKVRALTPDELKDIILPKI